MIRILEKERNRERERERETFQDNHITQNFNEGPRIEF